MLKKTARFFDRWGHYVLALFCAAAILLSALWTNTQRAQEQANAQALSDQSQRLNLPAASPTPPLARPVSGDILRPFCDQPVFFPEYGLWQIHPAMDFAAAAGDPVCALTSGRVAQTQPFVRIDHETGAYSLYKGLGEVSVVPGQQVRRGERIGTAGGEMAFEGKGLLCVSLIREGQPWDFQGEIE